MAVLKLTTFGGEVPVQGDRALPDTFAVESVNTWLYGQELRAIHPSTNLRALISTTRKVFRIPRGTVGGNPSFPGVIPPPSYLGDSTWLEFNDADTDIVRGPLVQDSYKRFYFCSPTTGPMFNTLARLIAGDASYKLGVPAPAAAPGGSVSGGAAPVETRAYVYTYINQYGEESGPSPPALIAGNISGTWNITGIADPAGGAFTGYANFTSKKLYRTVTGTSGATTYYFVANIAAATTTYADSATNTAIAGNLMLETANGALPPATLKGIVLMPNGFLIGWDGSDIYFSEPYKLHLWPAEYIVSTEFPIVGMGVFGQTCAVLTQGYPATISGVIPATTSLTKSTVFEPCLSRGGIVSTPDGVLYPSPNGLVAISSGGINVVTQQLITREQWRSNYNPDYIRAVRYQQGYLALRAGPGTSDRSAFMLDLSDLRTALTEFSEFDTAHNVQGDIWSGEVFTVQPSQLQQHDPPGNKWLPFRWRSKEFQYPVKTNFSSYALFWDAARFDNTSTEATDILASGVAAHLKVWADRVLVYDQNVPLNMEAVRLPSGFKATLWQFEITARAPVYAFHIASSLKELRGA